MNKDIILNTYIKKIQKKPKQKTVKQSKIFQMKTSEKIKIPMSYSDEIESFIRHVK